MALHCLSIYSGLTSILVVCRLSLRCLTLVFASASLSTCSVILASISFWISISFFLVMVKTSFIWRSSAFSSIIFFQVLLFAIVASFIKLSFFISSILLACRICFLVMVYSTGIWPVSFRRIVVGVSLGRYRIVLIASLRIVWSLPFSSLTGIQLSQAYVSMGIIMESTSYHIAFILIPLNS